LQRGIEKGLGDIGASLLIAASAHFQYGVPSDIGRLPLRGIILHGHFLDHVLRRYARMDLPVVLADHVPVRWAIATAAVDNQGAVAGATRRLIELGHRHIAFVRHILGGDARDVDPDARERQAGYTRALKAAGLPVARDLIVNVGKWDRARWPALSNLYRRRPRPTAVVASDAGCARSALGEAEKVGLSVPRDLSIVCLQPLRAATPVFGGPCIDFEAVGRRAAKLFDEPFDPDRVERVPAVWRAGRTVAPPR
jgi:DNA-binding LacI/PurR family transcriptional regulator